MKLYGGIRIGDDVIGITHMPDRKRPCLYYQKGYVIYPLAYFTSEEHADLFWEQLQRFTVKQSGKESEMSWWSDGEPFDEYEGCKRCNFNKHPTKETCDGCKSGDKWNYKDWDEDDEIVTDCPWK